MLEIIECPDCGGIGRLAVKSEVGGFLRAEQCKRCEGEGKVHLPTPEPRMLYWGPCLVCGVSAPWHDYDEGPLPKGEVHEKCRIKLANERLVKALAAPSESELPTTEPEGKEVVQMPGFRTT